MKQKILITAIICVTALEAIAMLVGINGSVLRIVIGAILLLAGVSVKRPKFIGK